MSHTAEPLVSTAWLQDHLADPDLVVLRVDEQPLIYAVGHIPGARNVDWRRDLQAHPTRDIPGPTRSSSSGSDWPSHGQHRRPVWRQGQLVCLLRLLALCALRTAAHGVARRRPPALAQRTPPDDDRHLARRRRDIATGTPARPRIPGDMAKPSSTQHRTRSRSTCAPPPSSAASYSPSSVAPRRPPSAPVTSPGARSAPWNHATNPDGTFLPADALHELYAAHGVTPERAIISYCRIGERSAHTWFVLHELLDHPDVKNYDGSWTEWGSMIAMPVELGADAPHLAPADCGHRLRWIGFRCPLTNG